MSKNTVINTYNESSLHKTLKNFYAIQFDGKTEVEMEGHIYDVVTKDGEVIEIQTKNVSKLLPKISDTLEKGIKVKLVHPVIITKYIDYFDKENNLISERKSPKKGSIYDIFREITGIYPILLRKDFTLEILEITMIEKRLKTEIPSKQNKRQRFFRDYIKTDKTLKEILDIKKFKTKDDYLCLLPASLPEKFCAKDLFEEFTKYKQFSAVNKNQIHLILWVYSKMNLIEFVEKKGNAKYYSINNKFIRT